MRLKSIVLCCMLSGVLGFVGTAALAGNVLPETGAAVEGPQPDWLDESPPLPGFDPTDPAADITALTGAYEAGQIAAAGIAAVLLLMAMLKKIASGRPKKSKLYRYANNRWVLWGASALASVGAALVGKLTMGEHLTLPMVAVVAFGVLAGSTTLYSFRQDQKEG
jgi:hypothetical protein